MKKILGLDLGTNSIGWAVVNAQISEDSTQQLIAIEAAGSRIIPMDAAILGDFDKGNSISQTAVRTDFRGTRRLRERYLLRRERLHRVLSLLNFLPHHYASQLDRYGKFTKNNEPKLAWNNREFLFRESFNEMVEEFKQTQPQLLENGKKLPYDWTIYFLRKKALTHKITQEELAWILLHFNQKRGYYQLRGEEEEENPNKLVEFYALKVLVVEDSGDKKGNDVWYNVHLENGWIYRRTSSVPLDWVGKIKEFIVTTDVENDGTPKTDKEGNVKRSFRSPKEDDWTLVKKRTEADIIKTEKTVGTYIYDTLLTNPTQKINGKLVRTIERKFYKQELEAILTKQIEFHPDLRDTDKYKACLELLYAHNEAHKGNVTNRGFTYLFIDDILFYQRPLKSKKSLISDCPYETRFDKEGNKYGIKCIAKSNPLFQEFRLWQFVANLKIYQREKVVGGKLKTDVEVTEELLPTENDFVALFEWLNSRTSIKQETLLNSYFKIKKSKGEANYPYRWNYVEDKEYPCNETRATILSGLAKAGTASKLTPTQEYNLWHILYSVEDKQEIEQALKTFASKNGLNEEFAVVFSKIKPFKKEYGAYSEKAIKKLLPLMRMGRYWTESAIDAKTQERIMLILTGEYDETMRNRVREKAIKLTEMSHFRGLPLWLACYIVYDRHSESKDIAKWESPADIDAYLKTFKQHSLRNPIVEQVITETLRTVRDIWKSVGSIDEIHVELGREMKNPADKRAQMTQQIQANENTNLRIKAMLAEFINPEYNIENVRPYSPSQQDILKIYEEYALANLSDDDQEFEFISKIAKLSQPSKADVIRYKLWLEQKYRSPYTGDIIPLAKLFTPAYEIEHVIPQSRYFDDSFSNKIICEAEINKLKDRELAYEFIKNHAGQKVALNYGKTVEVFSVEAYEKFIKDNYARMRSKMKKLLLEDIPDGFIERQLNDSRYISKVVKNLLSNIVREKLPTGEYEPEAVSKNLISCTGGITDKLKKDWGVNDVWNKIILPRFKRLNELTQQNCFTTLNQQGKEIPIMPLELSKGFNKKRIDHRHHAMDAIVIACATRSHVNLLNNEAAKSENKVNRHQLSRKLRRYEKVMINGVEREVAKEFLKPWGTFIDDVEQVLSNMVVSFKQNLRVINKTSNHYQRFENGKKISVKQTKGDSWAIRKPMHKDTVYGEVNLRKVKEVRLAVALETPKAIVEYDLKKKIKELLAEGLDAKKITQYFTDNTDAWSDVNLSKIKVYYFTKESKERYFATRKSLDTSFNKKRIEEKITDTGIQKILLRYLEAKGNNPELAFSADGIDELNRTIATYNGGKYHQPIYKVREYEKAEKFNIGASGAKSKKFVEAAQGTNLYFAIYKIEKEDKKTGEIKSTRSYATVPLKLAIDCQKEAKQNWKARLDTKLKEQQLVDPNGKLLFILSPNDLVYLPTQEELENKINIGLIDKNRLYKFTDSSDTTGNFIPHTAAQIIFSINKKEQEKRNLTYNIQDEFGVGSPQSKNQKSLAGEMIKETCIPIKVDRIGKITMLSDEQI